jgi:hypothetical protein
MSRQGDTLRYLTVGRLSICIICAWFARSCQLRKLRDSLSVLKLPQVRGCLLNLAHRAMRWTVSANLLVPV